MKPKGLACFAVAALALAPMAAFAQAPTPPNPPLAPLQEPAKTLPVPYADISPAMQAFIAQPLNPDWNDQWKTGAEARAYANKQAAGVVPGIPAMLARLHVTMKSETMTGVHVYVLTPEFDTAREQGQGSRFMSMAAATFCSRASPAPPRAS